MTVFVIAMVEDDSSAGVNGIIGIDLPSRTYFVPFNGVLCDDDPAVNGVERFGGSVSIPLGTSAKKADEIIRQAVADKVLSISPSFVIDPDDIYFPAP